MTWILIVGFGLVLFAFYLLGVAVSNLGHKLDNMSKQQQERMNRQFEFILDAVDEFSVRSGDESPESLSDRLIELRRSLTPKK